MIGKEIFNVHVKTLIPIVKRSDADKQSCTWTHRPQVH